MIAHGDGSILCCGNACWSAANDTDFTYVVAHLKFKTVSGV